MLRIVSFSRLTMKIPDQYNVGFRMMPDRAMESTAATVMNEYDAQLRKKTNIFIYAMRYVLYISASRADLTRSENFSSQL